VDHNQRHVNERVLRRELVAIGGPKTKIFPVNENPIPLKDACQLFPSRTGRPVTVATLRYRIKRGCRGVKLEGFLSGGNWYTTQAAIDRFHAKQNAKHQPPPPRRKMSQEVRDRLTREGVLRD
jgi:hypothetical protein